MYQYEPQVTDIVRILLTKTHSYYLADSTKSKDLARRRVQSVTGLTIYALRNNHQMAIL